VTRRAHMVGKPPYGLCTGNKPVVSHMRVFGSTCWVVLHNSHINGRFGHKSAKGVFPGYPDGSKAYKVFSITARSSRHEASCVLRRTQASLQKLPRTPPRTRSSKKSGGGVSKAMAEPKMPMMATRMTSEARNLKRRPTTFNVVAALKTRCVGEMERGEHLWSAGARGT